MNYITKPNKMKKILNISIIAAAITLILSSCGKYEDGPGMSLRSKKGRVAGEWVIEKSYTNGVEDSLNVYQQNCRYVFEKDGSGAFVNDEYTLVIDDVPFVFEADEIQMEWEFDDKKENIRTRLYNETSSTWQDWNEWFTITRLTNKEMWFSYTEVEDGGNVETEIHFKRN
ncbi:MAG: hypothetical protein A2W91_16545 [Bacteroidetes bacterium GWF2_38_335]|nr:MAG: hypothetical protein A2W91_16545 [Bacteroidetes bacterium GWF2_38_335]OFY81297.1 MAG: hypothetical protein A2281_07520 [Bacteroidetes bacterium RIFOXYA12_FULL_38_20]HBS85417.1 hypothetical protein [Bacteroidales bacterium]